MNFDNYLPSISIDCVLFGFHDNELKVLLLRMKGMDKWALPGGFVERNQHLEEGAQAVLHNRTGLDNIFLQQFQRAVEQCNAWGRHQAVATCLFGMDQIAVVQEREAHFQVLAQ